MSRGMETKRHTEVGINGFLGKARGYKLTPNRAREQWTGLNWLWRRSRCRFNVGMGFESGQQARTGFGQIWKQVLYAFTWQPFQRLPQEQLPLNSHNFSRLSNCILISLAQTGCLLVRKSRQITDCLSMLFVLYMLRAPGWHTCTCRTAQQPI